MTEPDFQLLVGQTWQDYERALEERDRLGRRYRITYDRGMLEIDTLSSEYGLSHFRLLTLLAYYSAECRIPFCGRGPFTWHRRDLDHGFEPDLCFYIQHEAQVRGRDIYLETDPPPDLAIEIETSGAE